MFTCLCNFEGTNCTKIIGWASNSKNPTTNAYVIIKVLSFFSLWEGRKSLYMPLLWFEKGEFTKIDVVSAPHM
jgi:hypothetical protein